MGEIESNVLKMMRRRGTTVERVGGEGEARWETPTVAGRRVGRSPEDGASRWEGEWRERGELVRVWVGLGTWAPHAAGLEALAVWDDASIVAPSREGEDDEKGALVARRLRRRRWILVLKQQPDPAVLAAWREAHVSTRAPNVVEIWTHDDMVCDKFAHMFSPSRHDVMNRAEGDALFRRISRTSEDGSFPSHILPQIGRDHATARYFALEPGDVIRVEQIIAHAHTTIYEMCVH
jgi:hypothetical protein